MATKRTSSDVRPVVANGESGHKRTSLLRPPKSGNDPNRSSTQAAVRSRRGPFRSDWYDARRFGHSDLDEAGYSRPRKAL